jgi:hypothetical protein
MVCNRLRAEIGAAVGEETAEDGAVAEGLVLAIAADGQVGWVGEGGEEVEEVGGVGLLHLGAKFSLEGFPGAGVVAGMESESDQIGGGREGREPEVVEVSLGEVGPGDAAGRTADGAEAETFVRLARSAEADDGDGHLDRVQGAGVTGYGLRVRTWFVHDRY